MAVDYTYSTDVSGNLGGLMGIFGIFFAIFFITVLAISVFMIIVMWKLYKKAGKEGWEAIVPIYNTVVLFQIVELNPLWVIAMFIPMVNIVAGIAFGIIISFRLAKVFGKTTGFGFGILFLPIIFVPLLAFGDAEYNTGFDNVTSAPVEPMASPPPVMTEPVVSQPIQPEMVVSVPTQPEVVSVVPTVEPVPVDPSTFASVVPTPPVNNDPNNQNNI